MPKRKRKTGMEEATGIVLGFATLVDVLFQRYTGKTLAGEKTVAIAEDMPLDSAYAILGLKSGASFDDVNKNYRNLAFLFHPDSGGYAEAMRLLNQAYERVKKEEVQKFRNILDSQDRNGS